MKYKVDKQERYTVFTLEEPTLDSLIAPDLKSELFLLSQEGTRNLILDLSQVTFVDSSGLSAILTGNRLWKETGTFIVAGELHPAVAKLIQISRLDTVLILIPTVSEAVDYVLMEEVERELKAD